MRGLARDYGLTDAPKLKPSIENQPAILLGQNRASSGDKKTGHED
jgi:hypothetical protein